MVEKQGAISAINVPLAPRGKPRAQTAAEAPLLSRGRLAGENGPCCHSPCLPLASEKAGEGGFEILFTSFHTVLFIVLYQYQFVGLHDNNSTYCY